MKYAQTYGMKVRPIDWATYQLVANGEILGEVVYSNLLYRTAQIKVADVGIYEVKPTGIFSSQFIVTSDANQIALLHMNWHTRTISYLNGQNFVLKAKQFEYNQFMLLDESGEALIDLGATFSWKMFQFNFAVSCEQGQVDHLLVLLAFYASHYLAASVYNMNAVVG